MKDNCANEEAVLLVIDDGDMLAMTSVVLMGKRRVLRAWNTEGALWILQNLAIASVVLRSGIAAFAPVHSECLKRGVPVHHMSGHVEADFVHLALPQLPGQSRRTAYDSSDLPLSGLDRTQPSESSPSAA